MAGYDLKLALQKVQLKRQNFAFYRGEEGDQILVSPLPPSAKQAAEIEEQTGEGKRMLKGVCFRDATGLVFATRNAVAPVWAKMIEKVLKDRKCVQLPPVTVRQLGPQESEEATGNEPEPVAAIAAAPSAAGSSSQAEWERLKSFLMPHLRTAIADPATKDKVTKVVLIAKTSEKAGDFAAASAIFLRLAGALQLPTPPPVRPPKAGKLQAAMNKLAPAFTQAVGAHPERKGEILRPVVDFQRQLKDGELEIARETLRQAGKLLQSVLA